MFRKLTLLTSLFAAGCLHVGYAQSATDITLISKLSQWKYLDNGSDQGTSWQAPAFDDASWVIGNAELGYGDGDEATIVSYGPSGSNKYTTTYFRKSFEISALPVDTQLVVIHLKRDDGAVVYLNGVAIISDNMPAGTINYTTFAASNTSGENDFREFTIDPAHLLVGTNTIAIEVHQCDLTSSDLSFDLSLFYRNILPLTPPLTCDEDLEETHISRFVSVLPSAQPDSLRIPATHTFQMLIQDGSPYSDSTLGVTKGLFDFTGYVPIEGSSKNGYLSINHELGSWPSAGVSMLKIHFDTAQNIWNVTNNTPVDFSTVQGTGRNCSGTVTPWNTIITAEETLPSSDANGDGYQDIGWLVEIDPATATIKDHKNDGNPQKLWGLGRMSHENVVIAADKKTAYLGNDENPGFIYRFVADNAEDLTAGQLYVLKLDGPLLSATTGSWVGIPNTTPEDCNNARTYADAVGATNFNQIEDVEISPLDGMIYFTSKSSSRVYRFTDNGSSISNMSVFVGNSEFVYNIETEDGIIEEQWRGGVDNLTFDTKGNLYVLQDGGRNHVWMVPPCHTQTTPAVKLFAVTPAGCEPTGMTMSPDDKFMFISMQHPSSSNTTEQVDAAGRSVKFNRESCIVIARKEVLGPEAIVDEDTSSNILPLDLDNKINVYPNPTEGAFVLAIESDSRANATVVVTNIQGADIRLLSQSLNAGTNQLNIDLSQQAAGVYVVHIYINNKSYTRKIIKK